MILFFSTNHGVTGEYSSRLTLMEILFICDAVFYLTEGLIVPKLTHNLRGKFR